MPNQVDGALVHAMSGNELSRVRTESGSVLPSHVLDRGAA